MMMYRLLEYSEIYLITSGSLWKYYVDEMHDHANENNVDNYRINNKKGVNLSRVYKTNDREHSR